MEADDFDVVFENSPLHQHLQDVGFSTADVQPEKICRLQNNASAMADPKKNFSDKQMPLGESLKKQLVDYVFDESWQNEVRHLCHKTTSQVLEDALKNSALREDDAAYVESFAASLRYEKTEEPSDTIMGQMLTQVGVLGVTMGYGFFRMFYMKSPDFSACFVFYALDILSVVMTVVALLPATLKFAMAGRLVGQLQRLSDAATSLLMEIHEFKRLMKRVRFFIHESELIKRGFTMVTAPISRLESGLHAATERQCPHLRRAVFHRARNVTLDFREATLELFKSSTRYTSGNLGDVTKYTSHLALSDFGPCMTLEDADDEKLVAATDDYCLEALKSMVEMMDVHVSEFVRVLCLLCLMQGNDYAASVTGFSKQLEVVEWLSKHLKENHRPMKTAYVFHKELETKMAGLDAKDAQCRSKTSSSPARMLHLAVHSLRLHLLSAAQRLQLADEQLESVCERDDDASAGDIGNLGIKLASDIKAVDHDLSACQNCFEELSVHLKKLNGEVVTDTEGIKDDAAGVITSKDVAYAGSNVSVIPDCDPVSEDQVFEGYTDRVDDLLENSQLLLENEEKCSQPEAVRVLAELKTVIAVRAEEMLKREEAALLKMETGANKNKGTSDEQVVAAGSCEVMTPANDAKPLSKIEVVESGEVPANSGSRDLIFSVDTVGMTGSRDLKQTVNSVEVSSHAEDKKWETGSDLPDLEKRDISCETRESDNYRTSAKVSGHTEDRLDSGGNPLDQQSVADVGHSSVTGLFSSAIAHMAVAKSHQMAALNVETFGDDWSDGDVIEYDDDSADDETV